MQKVSQLKSTTPTASKLLIKWVIGAAGLLLITLMFGIGGASYANENNVNQTLTDYTRWNLPKGAKRRLGKGMFTDMQLSQDGNRLAIASSTGIWIYDVEKGKEIALLTENTDLIGLVAFSPDGKTIACTGGDNTCRIWNVENQKLLSTFKLPKYWIRSIRFLDDGKTLVGEGILDKRSYSLINKNTAWDIPKVWIWDSSTGKMLDSYTAELPRFNPLKDVRTSVPVKGFIKNARVLFAHENKDYSISVMDGRTEREILSIPRTGQEKREFVFSPDGKRLAIAYDRIVHLWDISIDSGGLIAMFPIHVANYSGDQSLLSFSKDGNTLAAASGQGITVWNVETRSHIATFMNVKGGLWEFVLSADGSTVVTMDHEGAVDFWSVTEDKHERTLTTGYTGRFTALTYAHDGKTIAATDLGKIHLWNTDTGTDRMHVQMPVYRTIKRKHPEWHIRGAVVPAEHGSDIISLAFSRDNTNLIAFHASGKIGTWDISTNSYKVSNPIEGRNVNKPKSFNSNPLTVGVLAAPTPQTPNIYHLIATSFENASVFVLEASAFSPDGEILATKNRDEAIEVWHVPTRKRLYTITSQNPKVNTAAQFTFSSNSQTLAISEGQEIRLSNVHSGETVAKLKLPEKKKNLIDELMSFFGKEYTVPKIQAIVLAQSERTVLAANREKTIYVWDVATQKRILSIKGHTKPVCKLALTNDGTILASGDVNGVINLWEIPTGEKLATFKPYVSPITQLVFSPDGKTLASTNLHSHFAGTILLWDVPSK